MGISVDILIIIILVLLTLSGVQILNLIVKYIYGQMKLRQMNLYIKRTCDLWYEYLMNEGPFTTKFVPKKKNDIQAVEKILLSYIKNISNPLVQSKIHYFAKAYLSKHYEKELKSRQWSRRMNALYRIVDFQLENFVPICDKYQSKLSTPEEQFQLFKIQSLFKKDALLGSLLDNKLRLSEIEYKQILSLLDEEVIDELLEQLEKLPGTAQYALIDFVSTNNNIEVLEKLESMLCSENSEMRIRALKGIEKVGVIQSIDPFMPFIQSLIWEERLMVTKIMGHLPTEDTSSYLETLLEDDNWRVRAEAAKSLANHKEGLEKLEYFIDRTTDDDVKEIASEVLVQRKLIVI